MSNLVSRRNLAPLGLTVVGLILATLALPLAQPASAQDDDATAILNKTVETMGEVQSFRFELSTVQGESIIMNNLELAGVEGAVQRPDRFEATITARVAIVDVDVHVVGIGTRLWVTDPLADDESYIEVTDQIGGESVVSEALTALVNPDEILLQAVALVEEPTIDGTETVEGVRTTRVVGTVDLRKLPQFQTATPEAARSEFLVLEDMPVTIWIDEEGHVLSMEIEGPLTRDESPDVVRRLDLSEIDEPVEIEEPVTP